MDGERGRDRSRAVRDASRKGWVEGDGNVTRVVGG